MRHYAIESCIRQKSLKPLINKVKRILGIEGGVPLPRSTDMSVSFNLSGRPVPVLCTKHTVFVAELIRHSFSLIGVESEIITGKPENYSDRVYIVICPQMFKRLPKKYIAFQMEQTISSRWLTAKYIKTLCRSCYVFDYSLINIKYFNKYKKLSNKIYYLPTDFQPGIRRGTVNYDYDVIFYGDPSSPRRQTALGKLQNHFNVKIVSEVFGEELYETIAKAKVVVNLHYYENAMLETTRLYETLSLGRSVIVSERSCDIREEERLESIVDFVNADDTDAMIERIAYWLTHEDKRLKKVETYYETLSKRSNAFDFCFLRFLLANDWLEFEKFYSLAGSFVRLNSNRVCLSLPETVERTEYFNSVNKYGFEIIPGLRHYRGWTGCGLSYKFIMTKAKEQGFNAITVCEDDVYFPNDFEYRFNECRKYLDENPEWDVFQGLNANVRDITVKKVGRRDKQAFIHVNRAVSTVFNCYNCKVFDNLINWDESNTDAGTNTIDRSLESNDLNVVIVSPFLVGHNEALNSTIWNGSNSDYSCMIEDSSNTFTEILKHTENCNENKCCD